MKTTALDQVFADLVNGNLTDAKTRAKRYGLAALIIYAEDELGWSHDRADIAAAYLKGDGTFQDYCDAEQSERNR